MTDLVISASRIKLLGQFVGGLVFAAGGLSLMFVPTKYSLFARFIVLEKQPRWKRSATRANLSMGAAPVNVPQAALGVKVSDLVQEIEQRRRAHA